jgi:hypothetical protein
MVLTDKAQSFGFGPKSPASQGFEARYLFSI